MHKDLKVDAIEELLGAHYLMHQLQVSPADTGHFGVQRRRTYVYFCHRQTGRYLFDVHEAYAQVTRVLRKHICTRPRDYFVATPTEVQLAAQHVALQRKIVWKPESRQHCCTEIIHSCCLVHPYAGLAYSGPSRFDLLAQRARGGAESGVREALCLSVWGACRVGPRSRVLLG